MQLTDTHNLAVRARMGLIAGANNVDRLFAGMLKQQVDVVLALPKVLQ
jgi:hypothetical protein